MKFIQSITLLAFACFVLSPYALSDNDVLTGVLDVSPKQIIGAEVDIVILDVRTSSEYKSGHILKAINLDVTTNSFESAIQTLDSTKTYLVHCGTNVAMGRAEQALDIMQAARFNNLVNLQGGYVGWVRAGGAVTEPTKQ